MTDQENLIQFSGCDENSPLFQGERTVFQKPGTPIIVHSILKASTRDNLIQLQTPVQKEPKRLKVHFETPSRHSSSLYGTKEDLETENQSPAGLDAIRDLDEKENWIERNLILTTMDHDDYITFSREILLDIVADMPIRNGDEKHEEVNEQALNTEGRWGDSKINGIAIQHDGVNSQFKEKKFENSQIERGEVSNMTETSDNQKTEVLMIRSGADARVQKDSDMQPGEQYYTNGKRNDISDFESDKENIEEKAVSSDEEFLSADEDLIVGEKVKSSEPTDPKRSYDLNFNGLDWLTVGEAEGMRDSSQEHVSEISICNQVIELALDAADLSQPTHQIVKSTVGDKNPFQSESEEKSDNYLTESNTPGKQMPDLLESKSKFNVSSSQSHKGTDDIDSIRSRKQLSNIPEEITNREHHFVTKCEMANSVDCRDNPVESVNNIANSPIVKKTDVAENNIETSHTRDLPNKSSKTENEVIGTFKPIKQLKSFPNKSYETDLKNDVDPFRPRKQLMNSQSTSDRVEEIHDVNMDLFKPRKKITNSDKLELNDAVIDPCKQSKQLINSFVITGDTELDPFKTRKQLSNSPFVSVGSEVDPFKTKKQLSNSPVVSSDAEVDPFKPSKKLSNSPVSAGAEVEPFKPSKKLANSPVFKDSSGNLEIYPAEPSTQVKDPPSKHSTSMEHLSAGDLKIYDTFSGVSGTEGPVSNQETVKQITCSNQSEQGLKMVHEEDDEEDLTVHTVAKRSQMDFPTGEMDLGLDSNTALDEAQFVPATEVFNDPAMLDMLEQFGRSENKTESSLSRISLYVKFDPLVKSELGPTNPRRISIRPKQLEKVKEFGLEESFLLLGTPPKKWKKPILPRDPNVTPTGTISTKRNKSVDLLFSISPEDQDQNIESGFKQPPCTPLLIGDDCQDGIIEVLKYTEVDWKKMKRQMTLEFQGHLLSKEKEWSQEMEAKTKASQKEIKEAQEKAIKLQANIENLMMVLSEYEKMINTLIAEKETVSSKSKENIEEIKKERDEIKKERDQALEDLRSLDKFVSDFHRRYDKMKAALEGYVQNEAILKKTAEDYQQKLIKTEKKLAVTKQDADKLVHVTKELEKVMAAKESDVSRLEAALKMKDLQISKLEQSLEQKDKEVKEVTDICEKLLGGVTHK